MTELSNLEADIQSCLDVLKTGGLILYPTDTIWGIGCDATNPEAVDRIYQLKRRSDAIALIVLVADPKDILLYTSQPDLSVIDHLKTKQKPTTVIYEGAIGLAPNLPAADGSIAIRITVEPFCRHLIKRFRKPVVSTSANISGKPSPALFKDISPEIIKGVNYVVTYRQHDEQPAQPSLLIRWENGKEIVVRE